MQTVRTGAIGLAIGAGLGLLFRLLAVVWPVMETVQWIIIAVLFIGAALFGGTTGVSKELMMRGVTGGLDDEAKQALYRERRTSQDRALGIGLIALGLFIVAVL